jgi:hypothetical protein
MPRSRGPLALLALPRERTTALHRAASETLNRAVLNPFIHRHRYRATARIGLLFGFQRDIRPRWYPRDTNFYKHTLQDFTSFVRLLKFN